MIDANFAGWSCYHCGETFKDEPSAELHFGRHEGDQVACLTKAEKPLLDIIRDQQDEIDELRHDDLKEWKAGAYDNMQKDFRRYFGANVSSPTAAFMQFEELRFERDCVVQELELHGEFSGSFLRYAVRLVELMIKNGVPYQRESEEWKLFNECKFTYFHKPHIKDPEGWIPVSDDPKTHIGDALYGFNAEWIDEDFCPSGVREIAYMGDHFISSKWDGCHDVWTIDERSQPTHVMRRFPVRPPKSE